MYYLTTLQIKTPGTAVFASQYYLSKLRKEESEPLARGPNIIGDVLIHPTAQVRIVFGGKWDWARAGVGAEKDVDGSGLGCCIL